MTTKVNMIALDTFHATSVRAEPLLPDDKFEIGEAEATELENRGLARRAEAKAASAGKKGQQPGP